MEPGAIDVEAIRIQAALRRISAKQLATRAGIPYERVGRLLRLERRPKPGELESLARAAGLPVSPATQADADVSDTADGRDDSASAAGQVAR